MVWYNGGSPLYEAVERHNNAPQDSGKMKEPAKESTCPPPQTERPQPRDPLSALLRDRDMMLIAALILILMHEKADKKLILALAFVLFA